MSDVAVTEQSNTPAPSPEPLNPVQALIARLEAEGNPAPASKAEVPTEGIEGAQAEIEAKGGEVPEQKAGESDQAYEIRLVKLNKELGRVRNENESLKRDAGQVPELKRKLQELETALKDAKSFPKGKRAAHEFIKAVAEGKVELEDDTLEHLPKSVRDKLAEVDKIKSQIDARNYQEIRSKETDIVSEFLKDNASEFRLFSRGDRQQAEALLDAFYQEYERTGVKPILRRLVTEQHERAAKLLIPHLKGEGVKEFLLGLDPELKALFGAEEPKQATSPASLKKGAENSDGPRSLTNQMSQHSSPSEAGKRRQSEAERKAEVLAEFYAMKRGAR